MYTLDAVGVFKIEHPPETYIYHIEPVADGVAAISSDNCLCLIDPLFLNGAPLHVIQDVHTEVTCLKALDTQNSIVCTAGRDGKACIFDFRAKSKVAELRASKCGMRYFMLSDVHSVFLVPDPHFVFVLGYLSPIQYVSENANCCLTGLVRKHFQITCVV
jgi:hypothetical protein